MKNNIFNNILTNNIKNWPTKLVCDVFSWDGNNSYMEISINLKLENYTGYNLVHKDIEGEPGDDDKIVNCIYKKVFDVIEFCGKYEPLRSVSFNLDVETTCLDFELKKITLSDFDKYKYEILRKAINDTNSLIFNNCKDVVNYGNFPETFSKYLKKELTNANCGDVNCEFYFCGSSIVNRQPKLKKTNTYTKSNGYCK